MQAKIHLRQPDTAVVNLLLQYVLELARFDQDYDLRDRARTIKHLLASGDDHATRVFLSSKPPPSMSGMRAAGAPSLAVGSLSHVVNHSVHGYTALPDFPTEKPDPSVRDEEAAAAMGKNKKNKGKKKAGGKAPKKVRRALCVRAVCVCAVCVPCVCVCGRHPDSGVTTSSRPVASTTPAKATVAVSRTVTAAPTPDLTLVRALARAPGRILGLGLARALILIRGPTLAPIPGLPATLDQTRTATRNRMRLQTSSVVSMLPRDQARAA